jgi:AbrB family looped-hinge helix DNA binding protein
MGPKIYGTLTLNEKGQVVIPVEARNALEIGPGSRLMIMGAPQGHGLMLVRLEDIEAKVKNFAAAVENAKNDNE